MTTKQEWISAKIRLLEKENKGRSHAQNIAIAYSMYEKEHKKMQQGGSWYDNNPPMFAQQSKNKDLSFSTNIDFNSLYTPSEEDRLRSLQNTMLTNYGTNINNSFANEASDYPENNNVKYNDNINYNIFNPFSGVSTEQALYSLGQSFGYKGDEKGWNALRGVAGAGKVLLGGARSFLSGLSTERENQKVYDNMRNALYDNNPRPIMAQEGGTISKADYLTGKFIVDEGQGNVELEGNEYVKDNNTAEVKKVIGDTHKDGGVEVNLTDAEVLSNYTKIGAKTAKELKEKYKLSVKKEDTFAKVMEKYEKKIGKTEIIEEQSKYIKKLGDVEKIKDATTKRLNENLLNDEIKESEEKLKELEVASNKLFEHLFKIQESIPKKGDGTQVLDKNGNPVMQEGGKINSNYKVADYIQSGVTNDKLGKGYYIYNSDGTREFVTQEGLDKYKATDKYQEFINRGGNINKRVPGTESKNYRPSDVIPSPSQSVLKPLLKVQSGVRNEKLGSGYYLYYKDPTEQGFDVNTDREFITNDAFNNIVLPSSSYQKMLSTQQQGKEGLDMNNNRVASLYQEGGRIEELAKKYNISLDRAYQLLQEGGQVAPVQEVFQVVTQMLQQGLPPEQIVQQLVQMGLPEQQAVQAIQEVANQLQGQSPQEESMEGNLSNPTEEGQEVPMAQEGIRIGSKFEDPALYKKQSATSEGWDSFGELLKTKPKEVLDEIKRIHPELYAVYFKDGKINKNNIADYQLAVNKKYDSIVRDAENIYGTDSKEVENLKSQIEKDKFTISTNDIPDVRSVDAMLGNYTSTRPNFELPILPKEDYEKVKKEGVNSAFELKQKFPEVYDKYIKPKGLTSDFWIGQVSGEQPIESIQPIQEQNTTIQRDINRTSMANLPVDYVVPPSEMQAIYKPEVSLQRIEPVKITPEPMLAEQERQRLAQQEALIQSGLPAQTQFAINAQGLASSQLASNDAIAKAEQFNAQNQFQADQFNIGQASKEDLSNEQFNVDYQNKMMATIANQERDYRNFINQLNLNQRQNFKDISSLNLTNAMFDKFKTDGSNITFVDQQPTDLGKANLTSDQLKNMSPEEYKNYIKQTVDNSKKAQAMKNYRKSQNA